MAPVTKVADPLPESVDPRGPATSRVLNSAAIRWVWTFQP